MLNKILSKFSGGDELYKELRSVHLEPAEEAIFV